MCVCVFFVCNYVTLMLYACMLSHFSQVQLFSTLWTVAHQAPLSMGFFRQEYWGGLPCPPPGDLPSPGIELPSLLCLSPALAAGFFTTSATWEALHYLTIFLIISPILIMFRNDRDKTIHKSMKLFHIQR